MQLALVISMLLHLAIVGGTLIHLQSRQELRVAEPEPVAVGMISPGEVTKVRQGVETAKLLEAEAKDSPKGEVAKKEAPRTRVAAAAAPPPPPPPPPPPEQKPEPVPAKAAEPPPVPKAVEPPPPAPAAPPLVVPDEAALKAEEQRKADEQRKAEEQARAEEQKRAEERKKVEEQKRLEEERRQAELKKKREEEKKRREAALKKKREEEKKRQEAEAAKQKQFNADKISALLNKVPDSAAPPPASTPSEQPTKAKGPTLGSAEGRDKQLSASEIAMLKGRIKFQLKSCWRLPSAGGGSDTPAVTLVWRLRQDGSLDGDPRVLTPRGDALFQLAADAAQRAVRACAPFDLPPEMYGAWQEIEWEFDPRKML